MDVDAKLEVFQEFLDCSGVMLWHYDSEMRLQSGALQDSPFEMLFHVGGSKQIIWQYCQSNELPGFCSDAASLLWLVVPRHIAKTLTDIYIIGPVFGSASSEKALRDALLHLQAADSLVHRTADILKRIPVIQHTLLVQYGMMLYRYLTGTKLDAADFQLITEDILSGKHLGSIEDRLFSREGTYAMEQEIFKAVEDGNIHYRHPDVVFTKRVGILCVGNPLRHTKNQVIACVTLLTRAAIRGGMPEGSAYSLSDWYIQMLEVSNDLAEVHQFARDAFDDFTRRVHKCKLAGHSKEIQECMSYIEMHFYENLTLESLARELGYSKNHLSTKFSREAGMSVSDYITQVRMDYAKLWLKSSGKSIQEISSDLNYSSVSYFSATFKKQTGFTPSEFRNQGRLSYSDIKQQVD